MRNKRFLTASAAIVMSVLIGVVLTYATIPAPNGVIYGCYDKSGSIRVIDNSVTTCSFKKAKNLTELFLGRIFGKTLKPQLETAYVDPT